MNTDEHTHDDEASIADHWDTSGIITKDSDPVEEYERWREFALTSPDWTGLEFSLQTFRDYIDCLKEVASHAEKPFTPTKPGPTPREAILLEALQQISDGDTMQGRETWTHADVIQEHYKIARQAFAKLAELDTPPAPTPYHMTTEDIEAELKALGLEPQYDVPGEGLTITKDDEPVTLTGRAWELAHELENRTTL